MAAVLLSATTSKWSELWTGTRRTLREIYREARTGKLRSSPYQKFATVASLSLIVIGIYLLISGD